MRLRIEENNKDLMDNVAFLVCVFCQTYNQKNFITDAMDGFVMQETEFPFVCTVIDDASTDGEQDVIRKYLKEQFDLQDSSVAYEKETHYGHVSFARHKTNKNCYFAVLFLKENHYSQHKTKVPYIKEWMNTKYVALCEGDDYWTDKSRLQKMVFFLESHPKYVLVTHRINVYNESTGEVKDDRGCDVYYGKKNGISFGRYYNRFIYWQTQTLRTMYRMDVYQKATGNCFLPKTDGMLSYLVLRHGKGYGINEYMGTYRIHSGGVWSNMSNFEKQYGNLIMYRNYYGFEKSIFAKLSYYAKYIDVYKRYPEELKSKEPIKNSIVLFNVFYAPFLYVKKKWFKMKRKLLRIAR